MRLDRNINPDGKGKYALIKLRGPGHLTRHGREITVSASMVDFGGVPETDFFVIRLKDKYAAPALAAYAFAAMQEDPEYGREVLALADKAAFHHPKHKPD